MNIFKRLFAVLRLHEAVRQADYAHKTTGERYYVMPNGKTGKLIIMDRRNFRTLKHKRYISSNVLVHDLEKECFYCTPYRNGREALPKAVIDMKRREYMKYLVSLEEEKKEAKDDK